MVTSVNVSVRAYCAFVTARVNRPPSPARTVAVARSALASALRTSSTGTPPAPESRAIPTV